MVCTHCLCDSSRLEGKVLGEPWKRVDFILLSLSLSIYLLFLRIGTSKVLIILIIVFIVSFLETLFIFQTRSHITQAGLEFPPGDLPSLPQMLR